MLSCLGEGAEQGVWALKPFTLVIKDYKKREGLHGRVLVEESGGPGGKTGIGGKVTAKHTALELLPAGDSHPSFQLGPLCSLGIQVFSLGLGPHLFPSFHL